MSIWVGVVIVFGWLALAVAAGVVIGALIKRRDRQVPQEAPESKPPRMNVDETTAVRAVGPKRRRS